MVRGQQPLAIVPSIHLQPSLAVSCCVFEIAYLHLRISENWARPMWRALGRRHALFSAFMPCGFW